MPRVKRVVDIGKPHHITQRGNYRLKVFEKNDDYQKYISWINEYSKKYGLNIIAYCLMGNHVHFICIPTKENSLSTTFNLTHMRYAQYINKRRKVRGHLWQGRFYSSILDGSHLIEAVRYVENNPVRAGIVKKAGEYVWSSAKEHTGKATAEIKLSENKLLNKAIKDKWTEYLGEKEEEIFVENIRRRTMMGRPLVIEKVLRKLEKKFNMRLEALPWGRPKKVENK